MDARPRRPDRERRDIYNALAEPRLRAGAVSRALDILERDPLASAGVFPGDLVRRLMELPPQVWQHEDGLYQRYRAAVRAAALARRHSASAVHRAFWRDLPARVE